MIFSFNYCNTLTLTSFVILFINLVVLNPKSIYSEAARTRFKNTLDVKFNINCNLPQCTTVDPDKSAINLFQVISSNPETPQKTNIIWSNIGGPPMVITTSSSQESNLLINWNSILGASGSNINEKHTTTGASESPTTTAPSATTTTTTSTTTTTTQPPAPSVDGFHFNITQDAAIGLLVEKIVLFDDTDKSGLFTIGKPSIEIDWNKVIWDGAVRTTYHKDDFLKSNLRMKPLHEIFNGTIRVKLAIPRNYKADRQQESPHLKLNNQSISIVIVVDGLQPPSWMNNARLAITLVVVVQSPSDQVSLDTDSESLTSDEYTPGVFRIKSLQFKTKQDNVAAASKLEENFANANVDVEGKTTDAKLALSQPMSANSQAGPYADKSKLGFLYWKEVAYTDRRRMISRTIDVYDNEVPMPMETLPNISQPFYQYFKYQPNVGPKPQYKLYRFEMIFGKGDSTYGSTNFTDFSFVFGLGAAPQEQVFSFLVKFIIFVCFCLPLLVMLAGLGYLMLRRFRRNGDTELLLAAES